MSKVVLMVEFNEETNNGIITLITSNGDKIIKLVTANVEAEMALRAKDLLLDYYDGFTK